MTDDQIVQLFLERSESAVVQTKTKYGKYCFSVAMNILNNNEDSEECVNDTYLKAWNCIPPHKPSILSVFLGKITRRLALDMYRRKNSEKRGGRVIEVSEELADCIVFSNDIKLAEELKGKLIEFFGNEVTILLERLSPSNAAILGNSVIGLSFHVHKKKL
jgi:RNA polymerase sigma-70 factor (ECF subfamily)